MAKDYYAVLGITKSANKEEIKKAYKSLVKQHHPDKFTDAKEKEAANKKFQEIQSAYDVLSDDKKRQTYDAYGHEGYTQSGGAGAGGGGFHGFEGFGAGGGFDIFNEFFSQFGGAQSGREYSRAQEGEDLRYAIEIDLEEAFKGTKLKIKLPRMVKCDGCAGHGIEKDAKTSKCHTCNGSGRVVMQQMFLNIQQTCPTCHGKGVSAPVCKLCRGSCRVSQKSELEIEVPKGVTDGLNLRMQREGNAGVEGGPNGDLFISVRVRKHALFEVEGNNLVCVIPISAQVAALGKEIEVPTIDGQTMKVNIPAGSQYGSRIKISGKGMPIIRSSARGDMFVKLNILIPTSMNSKEKELWKALLEESEHNAESKSFLDKVKKFLNK